ncbi:hypothetical protein QBC39DRAFT_60876 [Podospora conica]|nr:hypothetical protein QBC39DRAFT_60876 [Schizothecium conicum]
MIVWHFGWNFKLRGGFAFFLLCLSYVLSCHVMSCNGLMNGIRVYVWEWTGEGLGKGMARAQPGLALGHLLGLFCAFYEADECGRGGGKEGRGTPCEEAQGAQRNMTRPATLARPRYHFSLYLLLTFGAKQSSEAKHGIRERGYPGIVLFCLVFFFLQLPSSCFSTESIPVFGQWTRWDGSVRLFDPQ